MKPPTDKAINGLVLEVQRFSTDDGPGIRTTVFMKGCPLACEWCHNPESIFPQPQVQWLGVGCLLCGDCVTSCAKGALRIAVGRVEIARDICDGCGACSEACPSAAIAILGKPWLPEALAKELQKDRAYFERSGGGVTVSGGEAVLQYRFVAALLERLQEAGIHTALDTSGHTAPGALAAILPHLDLLLFDLKLMNSDRHKRLTGKSNETILARARDVAHAVAKSNGRLALWVRTPIIPAATDSAENIKAIGAFIAEEMLGAPCRWELCAFNNLCRDKYIRLGKEWQYQAVGLIREEQMARLASVARASGVAPEIVHWSGPVRHD